MSGFKLQRLGLIMEPDPGNPQGYERRPGGGGGSAFALSADVFHWRRLGLATSGGYHGVEVRDVDDKDASLIPVAIRVHQGDWNWPCSTGRAASKFYYGMADKRIGVARLDLPVSVADPPEGKV